MKYRVFPTKKYKKSLLKLSRSGRFNRKTLDKVLVLLAHGQKLDFKYQDHQLVGESSEYRECHIQPDLLLIYKIEKDVLILLLVNIGSHSDLFG